MSGASVTGGRSDGPTVVATVVLAALLVPAGAGLGAHTTSPPWQLGAAAGLLVTAAVVLARRRLLQLASALAALALTAAGTARATATWLGVARPCAPDGLGAVGTVGTGCPPPALDSADLVLGAVMGAVAALAGVALVRAAQRAPGDDERPLAAG